MKKILFVLTAIYFIGFVSSIYLSGSFGRAFLDTLSGFLQILSFWGLYFGVVYFKKEKDIKVLNVTQRIITTILVIILGVLASKIGEYYLSIL